LTDTAPTGIAAHITSIAERISGVVNVQRVRARAVGPELFVDLGVTVSRLLPLDRVSAVKDRLAGAIRKELPNAEVTVTIEPRALDNETVLERVTVIARNRALAVHHVTVHAISGRLSVSLDLEVDRKLALTAAHDVASELEKAIQDELGPDVEVETHIEPLQLQGLAGREAPAERVSQVRTALAELAAGIGAIRQVHDVRVRETAEGEIVNFHCRVDPTLTVQEVHEKVDEVERGLRRRFSTIKRVIGHAEPRP
jgi:divalent metal cation (Fe/Co/Zn/Cd) transporter